jgi:SAM-dependent methyltransferase
LEYELNISTFHQLLTPAGQQALAAAGELKPREVDFLLHFSSLARRFPPDIARASLEIAILREEALQKFPFSGQMYFTRPALEQATPFEVAAYRGERYRSYPLVLDLGCSVGGDTLALASLTRAAGLDLDPLRLEMAKANLAALGLSRQALFIRADLRQRLPFHPREDMAVFFDPARRSAEKRAFSIYAYQPPLSTIHEWLPHWPALGVKISPGVKLEELSPYEAELEFISLKGELKEGTLWFGPLKTAARRATVLPGPHTMAADSPSTERLPLSEPQAYLYEPDPSILRAGLVAPLGLELDASQLDAEIAYLTAATLQPTPFARSWPVEDWFPFGLKRLRSYLRERQVGHVVVKKRGSPLSPEKLIHDLRLRGLEQRVVFLTQMQGRPVIVVCYTETFLL